MSADNGIYILVTPKKGNVMESEYRVAHAQAIENLDYGTDEMRKYSMVEYFGRCEVFTDRAKALEFAHDMAKKYSVLEYGVCELDYTSEVSAFPSEITLEQCKEFWDTHWNEIKKTRGY